VLYLRMDKKPHSRNRWLSALGFSALAAVSLSTATAGTAVAPKNPGIEAADWRVNTISPVTNPIFFEDPVIRSEIRPIFAYHTIDNGFITGGGHATLYALQIRYALTDRLALIATQDGHLDVDSPVLNVDGWMDLAVGFKYALINDLEHQFILTPGLTFHIPTGDREVFQGRGGGEFNPFVSFAKGYGDLHITGNVGLRIPVSSNEQNLVAHYSLMVDYYTCRWFIPFVHGELLDQSQRRHQRSWSAQQRLRRDQLRRWQCQRRHAGHRGLRLPQPHPGQCGPRLRLRDRGGASLRSDQQPRDRGHVHPLLVPVFLGNGSAVESHGGESPRAFLLRAWPEPASWRP
jgi:hypothetical protein